MKIRIKYYIVSLVLCFSFFASAQIIPFAYWKKKTSGWGSMNWANHITSGTASCATLSNANVTISGSGTLWVEDPGNFVFFDYSYNDGAWTTIIGGGGIAVTNGATLKFRARICDDYGIVSIKDTNTSGSTIDQFNFSYADTDSGGGGATGGVIP